MLRSRFLPLFVLLVAAFAALGVVCALSASQAFAQDAHASRGKVVLDELSVEERQRARRIWADVICNCPRENWSKTLSNCPDGCADEQKQTILRRIQEGRTDQEILDEQLELWGPKVMARPDDAMTYALPVIFLLVCVFSVAIVLGRWKRRAAEARAAHHLDVPADEGELAAVERELGELR